jgi:hypothetical protein
MGSFTEVVLSFDFAASTPEHVLAAFSALATPAPPDAAWALPASVEQDAAVAYTWEPDFQSVEEGTYLEPWREPWSRFVRMSQGPTTTPHGLLVRTEDGQRWNLDCRFSWKIDPWLASDALAWLAPYIDPGLRKNKALAGYAQHEAAPRPHLFWVADSRWEVEDLNPDEEWLEGL